MNNFTIILHLILAIVLVFITNGIGKVLYSFTHYLSFTDIFKVDENKAFDSLFKSLAAPIYTVFLSIVLIISGHTELTDKIWIVSFFYMISQFLLISFILGRYSILNKKLFFFYHLISISISFFIYQYAIVKGLSFLLPDEANFRTEIWFIVIIFFYKLLDNINVDQSILIKKQDDYVQAYIKLFTKKYKKDLEDLTLELKALVVSIMIYENFNRPPKIRMLENLLFKLHLKRVCTLGLMQISTDKYITDAESVKLGIEKLKRTYLRYKDINTNGYHYTDWNAIVSDYNPGISYYSEVSNIMNKVQDYYKSLEAK